MTTASLLFVDVSPAGGAPRFGFNGSPAGEVRRHATAAWQRILVEALAQVGDLHAVNVTAVAKSFIAASLTAGQHRTLTEAAWLLQRRGALHLSKTDGSDYRGGAARHLLAWTCARCTSDGGQIHLPRRRCAWCSRLTDRRDARNEPDCGRHR